MQLSEEWGDSIGDGMRQKRFSLGRPDAFPTANRGGAVEFQGSKMMLSIPFSGGSARSE